MSRLAVGSCWSTAQRFTRVAFARASLLFRHCLRAVSVVDCELMRFALRARFPRVRVRPFMPRFKAVHDQIRWQAPYRYVLRCLRRCSCARRDGIERATRVNVGSGARREVENARSLHGTKE